MTRIFSGDQLSSFLDSSMRSAIEWVRGRREQDVLSDRVALEQEAITRHSFEPIVIDRDGIRSTAPKENVITKKFRGETTTERNWAITLDVPYTGGSEVIFRLQASRFMLTGQPEGYASREAVHLEIFAPEMTADALNQRSQEAVAKLEELVRYANVDLAAYNASVTQAIRSTLDARTESINARRQAATQLDFPIRPADPNGNSQRW